MATAVAPIGGSGGVTSTAPKYTQEQIKGFIDTLGMHFKKEFGDKPFDLAKIKLLAIDTTAPKELREAAQFFSLNTKLLEALDKAKTGDKDLKTVASAINQNTLGQVMNSLIAESKEIKKLLDPLKNKIQVTDEKGNQVKKSGLEGADKADAEKNSLSADLKTLYKHFHGAHGNREFNIEQELKNIANNPKAPKELAAAAKLIVADKGIMDNIAKLADVTGKKDRMTAEIFNKPEGLIPRPSKDVVQRAAPVSGASDTSTTT